MNDMFSVIIPTYNNAGGIAAAISSVLNQSLADFEVIVVDDGSTDKTGDIVRSFNDRRIKYFKLEKNSGVHVARNLGLEKAGGQRIVFLDSDDELFPLCLEEFSKIVSQYPNAGFCIAPYLTNTDELTCLTLEESGFVRYEDLLCQRLSRRIKPGVVSLDVRLAKSKKFVAQNMDFIYYRYIMRSTDNYYLVKPLGRYNLSHDPNALHVNRKVPNISRSIMRGVALDDFLKDFKKDYLKYCPASYSRCAYGAAVGLILQGHYVAGFSRSKDALRYGPFKLKYLALFLLSALPVLSTMTLKFSFRLKKLWHVRKF